jgi:hypothetical protein
MDNQEEETFDFLRQRNQYDVSLHVVVWFYEIVKLAYCYSLQELSTLVVIQIKNV